MPQVATPNLVEVVCQVNGALGSGPHYNVYHVRASGTPLAAATAAVSGLKTFYDAIKNIYRSTTTIINGFKCIDRTAVPWVLLPVTSLTTTGTGVSGPVAPQLAMVISWRTLVIGKSFRGRTFLGPLDLGASSGSGWAGGAPGLVATAAQAYISGLAGGSAAIASVFSPTLNNMTPINSLVVSSAYRTLRSRA